MPQGSLRRGSPKEEAKKRARPGGSVPKRRLSSVGTAGEPGSCAGAGRSGGEEAGRERAKPHKVIVGSCCRPKRKCRVPVCGIFEALLWGVQREVGESKRKRGLCLVSPSC